MVIKPIVAGNWKMNGFQSSKNELKDIISGLEGSAKTKNQTDYTALICPPYTLIACFAELAANSALLIGAQDCHPLSNGANTGDISAEMIKDLGASHTIIGHSERRCDHDETDIIVRSKHMAVLRAGLKAILCVGEQLNIREEGRAEAFVETQLRHSVAEGATAKNTLIAYEPVWAIGTGHVPSVADVERMHAHIRAVLTDIMGAREASQTAILYGGSVKPSNAAELMGADHVNGALVGGASLKAVDFLAIIEKAYG